MAVSKWKIVKYLLPLAIVITVGLITKSWSTKVVAGESSIIHSDKVQNEIADDSLEVTTENLIQGNYIAKTYSHCDSIYKSLIPREESRHELIDYIIQNAIQSDSTGSNNRFLTALKEENENYNLLAFDRPLQGIYKIKDKSTSIIADIHWKEVAESYIKESAELDLIKKYHPSIDTIVESNKVNFFSDVLALEFKNVEQTVYTFSNIEKKISSINELGLYKDECLEYTNYTFKKQDSTLLIGSRYNIDLEFKTFNSIDTLLNNIKLDGCKDCPDGLENMKTFAKLKGVDNMYFTYSNYVKKKGLPHLPSRALIYVDNEKVKFLWIHEVDLFGCACL